MRLSIDSLRSRMPNLLIWFMAPLALLAAMPVGNAHEFSDFPPLQGMQRLTTHNGEYRLDLLVRHDETRRPVLVLLPGSVCTPTFVATERERGTSLSSSTGIPRFSDQRDLGFHIAMLERRNLISLEGPAGSDIADYVRNHPCTEKHGGLTLEHRVQDTLAQLEHLRTHAWAGPILLAGFSEGSDVAAAVAADPNSRAQSLLLMSGAGTSQFFDFINQHRTTGDASGVAQVFSTLDAFVSGNPPEDYLGHAPERWRSFAISRTPMDTLLLSSIPVFIVHGERDTNVPIASIDVLVTELMRKQPDRAIFYWSMPGADHSLRNDSASIDDVYAAYIKWALGDPQGRTYHSASTSPVDSAMTQEKSLPTPATTN